MTTIAIHQPNYLPWLGYFAKIARADIFVFLDDVQFSKGSYTNRVQIADADAPRWLTLPVSVALGDPIDRVNIARSDTAQAHLGVLKQLYRHARHHASVWPWVEQHLLAHPEANLARRNEALVVGLAQRLGLRTRFARSSDIGHADVAADERLARIVDVLAPGGIYLSGHGAKAYQSDAPFAARGIALRYSFFVPTPYDRSGAPFVQGLSIVDALFHVGFDATAALVRS